MQGKKISETFNDYIINNSYHHLKYPTEKFILNMYASLFTLWYTYATSQQNSRVHPNIYQNPRIYFNTCEKANININAALIIYVKFFRLNETLNG